MSERRCQCDEESFTHLLEEHRAVIMGEVMSFKRGCSDMDIDDAVQVCHIRLWERLGMVLAADNVRAYVRRLVRNTLINHTAPIRRHRRMMDELCDGCEGVGLSSAP